MSFVMDGRLEFTEAGGGRRNLKFEMALLTSSKNQEKADQGFRLTGAEIPLEGLGAGFQTAPPRPIFARALANGRENRAARSSG